MLSALRRYVVTIVGLCVGIVGYAAYVLWAGDDDDDSWPDHPTVA